MPDIYSNIAAIQCTESAANTLTFQKLETGVSLFEKQAWLISRISYWFSTWNIAQFADEDDYLDVALCATNNLTSIAALSNPAVLDLLRIQKHEEGTPAAAWFNFQPVSVELSQLAGGGLLVPPNPIYLGVKGSGLAAAQTVICRFFYTTVELKAEQYWELVEARRIISS